jgi:hypothetical protein
MSIRQTELRQFCTGEFNGALSVRLPSETQVLLKRSKGQLESPRYTFTPATKNSQFLNESGIYVNEASVTRGTTTEFGFNGGVLKVKGPGRITSKGYEGYFKGGGRADWTGPVSDVDPATDSQAPELTTEYNVTTFTGLEHVAPQKLDVLTIEVSPEQQGLAALHLAGGPIDLQSMPGFMINDLLIDAPWDTSTVRDTQAGSARVSTVTGDQHLEGLNAQRYAYTTNSGTIHGPKNPRGQGTIRTTGGTVIVDAPQHSMLREEANTLKITTNCGPVFVNVPEGYAGSVQANSTSGDIIEDGMPLGHSYYKASDLGRSVLLVHPSLGETLTARYDEVTIQTTAADVEINFIAEQAAQEVGPSVQQTDPALGEVSVLSDQDDVISESGIRTPEASELELEEADENPTGISTSQLDDAAENSTAIRIPGASVSELEDAAEVSMGVYQRPRYDSGSDTE